MNVSFSYCGYKIPDNTHCPVHPSFRSKTPGPTEISVKKLNSTGRCPHIHLTSADKTIQNKFKDYYDVCVCKKPFTKSAYQNSNNITRVTCYLKSI